MIFILCLPTLVLCLCRSRTWSRPPFSLHVMAVDTRTNFSSTRILTRSQVVRFMMAKLGRWTLRQTTMAGPTSTTIVRVIALSGLATCSRRAALGPLDRTDVHLASWSRHVRSRVGLRTTRRGCCGCRAFAADVVAWGRCVSCAGVLFRVVHCGMFNESVHRPRLILLRCFQAWRSGLSSLEIGVT